MDLKKNPLLFDGAFGTYYHDISGREQVCELACISEPETVLRIHREYLAAGARAIKTNTFGANSLITGQDTAKVIKSGYELARKAAGGTGALVFADIGPISPGEETEEYFNIASLFIESGAKYFLFETMPELDPLLPVFKLIKKASPDAFILMSFAVSQDGYTKQGLFFKDIIPRASQNGDIDAVGINCLCGPSHAFKLIEQLDIKGKPFSAMPNSGYPMLIGSRTVYNDNPEYFAEKISDIAGLGVSILGGCCGTTPEHIRMAANLLNRRRDAAAPASVRAFAAPSLLKSESGFKEKLNSGKKVVAVELDPPTDTRFDYLIPAAQKAREAGADILTVADCPLALARAESILTAAKLMRETGMEVLPHLSCRDRSYASIKSSLLSANMEGIRNIFAVTGDPPAQTERDDFKSTFHFNSFGLLSYIKSLNESTFSDYPFYMGAALNVNAEHFNVELGRAQKKVSNGAEFFLTQPLYSDRALENLRTAKEKLGLPVLAGIMPIVSYKNAMFLINEIAGIDVPLKVAEAFKDKAPDEAKEISFLFSLEIIKKAYPYCSGYYLITPLKKIDMVLRLIPEIKAGEY